MKSEIILTYKFVEYIPNVLKERTIYVSTTFATVAHKCCCGCGNEVITPLSPTDWKLIFDGDTISLYPSIGNWNFECKSHYWVRKNKVKWAPQWSQKEVNAGRAYASMAKERYFNEPHVLNEYDKLAIDEKIKTDKQSKETFWLKLKNWLS